jgi:hypothetical protein
MKTSQIFYVVVAVIGVCQVGSFTQSMSSAGQDQQERAAFSAKVRETRQDARNSGRLAEAAEGLSSVALARVEAGCVAVTWGEAGQVRLFEGVRFETPAGQPITGINTICTVSGDTALTLDSGEVDVSTIARVSASDKQAYNEAFNQLSW